MLDADEIRLMVIDAIGGSWDETNHHGVDLREALVHPRLIKVIDRRVREGEIHDTVVDAWLVLIEDADSTESYRIVASADGSRFALAVKGFPADERLVLCGWYGDFMSAFMGM